MTFLDIAIVAVLALCALHGLRQGLLTGAAHLGVLLLSGVAGLKMYRPLGELLMQYTPLPAGLANLAAIVGVFIVTYWFLTLLVDAVLGPLRFSTRIVPPLRLADRLGGAFLGVFTGGVILALLVSLLGLFPVMPPVQKEIERSFLAARLSTAVGAALPRIEPLLGQAKQDTALFVGRTSEDQPSWQFRFPSDLSLAASERLEERMLEQVNEERASHGLPALAMDDELREVARQHSREMFELGYIGHESPVSGTPLDRLLSSGVSFLAAGENLAYAPSIEVAHEGLMNSEGHRRNILSPAFSRVGIGVIDGGLYGKMFTQVFAD